MAKRLKAVRLTEAVTNHPGMWVAIKDGVVVDVQRTPDELLESLHRRDITGAIVTRMPGEFDKELVGLG